jgi:DNA-binding transcriptional LysR family regulator
MLADRLLDGRLKLRHLTMVSMVAERGTVVAAAKALHVTQPVVTRALHEVEEILGVPLFVRGPQGMTLTLYGENFVTHARSILGQIRQAGDQVEALVRADLGRVQVGTHLAGANLLLPRGIAAVKAAHPTLTVVVREGTPDVLQDAVLTGDLDLMVGRLQADPPAMLRQERHYREPVSLVARVGHPAHALSEPTLNELSVYPWILPVTATTLRRELEGLFAAEGVMIPSNRIECTSMPTLHELLLSADVIAALPMLIAVKDPELSIISTPLHGLSRPVGVTLPADRPISPAGEELLRHLRTAAATIEKEMGAGLSRPGGDQPPA